MLKIVEKVYLPISTEYLPEWFEEQSDRVASVFDADSYRFVWPEENNTDFKYSSQKPSRLEVRQLPSFIVLILMI